jgi:aryl-alcohol dehydrogenase-like predicted oxidoreductase
MEDTLEAYAQLIRQGKVRAIGASNFSAGRLALALQAGQAHGYPLYRSLQPQYNLYDRADYEKELEPLCREKGLGVITYFSLASGFLTGKYRTPEDVSQSARARFVEKYLNARGFRILDALAQVAAEQKASPATVALA